MTRQDELNRFVDAVRDAAEDFPALRIGQLLLNAVEDGQLYYITNADLIDAIEKYGMETR